MLNSDLPIILDFDDTCFDTKRFKPLVFSFLSSLGFSQLSVEATYQEARNDPHGYSPLRHFERLRMTKEGMKIPQEKYMMRQNEIFSQCPHYLFSDAKNFISTHQKKIILLTAGESTYQNNKIRGCNLTVPVITCQDGDKARSIKKIFAEKNIDPQEAQFIFVDNTPPIVKEISDQFPVAQVFLMDRTGKTGISSFNDLTLP